VIFPAVIEYSQNKDLIAQVRPAHRAYLSELLAAGKLVAAGPFLDDYGALIIYEADHIEAVERLIQADPFHAAGVFLKWTIRPWKMVFANPELMPK
jgi:uncharacterized protein YciI